MQTDQNKIEKLFEFKRKDKFSTQAWNERGLNPSSDELCGQLTSFFDALADKLVNTIEGGNSTKQLKALLKSEIASLNKSNYDTEEKEFICDLFHQLATIVNVDFNENINKWLYGSILTTLMKFQKVIRPEKIVETLRQPCTKCETELQTYVLRKEKGLAATSFLIVKCNNCGELNLIPDKPDIKELRFGNYTYVETLHRDDYSYEQALLRMEQIKVFRE